MNGLEIVRALDRKINSWYSVLEKENKTYFYMLDNEIWSYLYKHPDLKTMTQEGLLKILKDAKENIPEQFSYYSPFVFRTEIARFENLIRNIENWIIY